MGDSQIAVKFLKSRLSWQPSLLRQPDNLWHLRHTSLLPRNEENRMYVIASSALWLFHSVPAVLKEVLENHDPLKSTSYAQAGSVLPCALPVIFKAHLPQILLIFCNS